MERLQIVKKRRCGRRCGEGRKLGSAWSCCWYKDGHTQFTTSIVSGNLGVLHRGQFGPAAKSWGGGPPEANCNRRLGPFPTNV
eukprot:scaffold8293_cov18-Tisochrysis_lutea.AAC.1